MHIDRNLQFITDRITETKVAIFHCFSNNVLKLPNMVVNTSKVDNNGNIWFFVKRPAQQLQHFEHEFACTLDFYKKGNPFSMKISGKATMFDEEKDIVTFLEISREEAGQKIATEILFKVKMIKVEYYDLSLQHHGNFWRRIKMALSNLLDWAEPNARTYEFN